jgi:hypothetical protein
MAAKIRQPRQDKKERAAEKDNLNKTARTGQPELFSQNRITRTWQADRTDRTGLPVCLCSIDVGFFVF